MTDEMHRHFVDAAAKPHVWQLAAREFMVAANYLLDWYDVSRVRPDAAGFKLGLGGIAPVMVLYATAIENLLKAIRIARGGTPVVDGVLSKHFKHHKLLAHAKAAKVLLSEDESDLLSHLSDFMEAGRYPVPTEAGSTPRAWRFDYPDDIERVWSMAEHLEKDLHETGKGVLLEFDFRVRYRPPGFTLPELQ